MYVWTAVKKEKIVEFLEKNQVRLGTQCSTHSFRLPRRQLDVSPLLQYYLKF